METNGGKYKALQNKRRETLLQEGANQAKSKSEESWSIKSKEMEGNQRKKFWGKSDGPVLLIKAENEFMNG